MKITQTTHSSQQGKARLSSIILLFLVLSGSWLLWSGLYKPLLIGLGLFSCLLTTYLAHRMGFFRHHKALLRQLPKLPGYWLWLLKEIVTSTLDVAKIILSPSLPISPTLVELKTLPKTDVGKVILGNSITLSPGTVTINLSDGKILVHCLTQAGAKDLEQGSANRRAAELEGKVK